MEAIRAYFIVSCFVHGYGVGDKGAKDPSWASKGMVHADIKPENFLVIADPPHSAPEARLIAKLRAGGGAVGDAVGGAVGDTSASGDDALRDLAARDDPSGRYLEQQIALGRFRGEIQVVI